MCLRVVSTDKNDNEGGQAMNDCIGSSAMKQKFQNVQPYFFPQPKI